MPINRFITIDGATFEYYYHQDSPSRVLLIMAHGFDIEPTSIHEPRKQEGSQKSRFASFTERFMSSVSATASHEPITFTLSSLEPMLRAPHVRRTITSGVRITPIVEAGQTLVTPQNPIQDDYQLLLSSALSGDGRQISDKNTQIRNVILGGYDEISPDNPNHLVNYAQARARAEQVMRLGSALSEHESQDTIFAGAPEIVRRKIDVLLLKNNNQRFFTFSGLLRALIRESIRPEIFPPYNEIVLFACRTVNQVSQGRRPAESQLQSELASLITQYRIHYENWFIRDGWRLLAVYATDPLFFREKEIESSMQKYAELVNLNARIARIIHLLPPSHHVILPLDEDLRDVKNAIERRGQTLIGFEEAKQHLRIKPRKESHDIKLLEFLESLYI